MEHRVKAKSFTPCLLKSPNPLFPSSRLSDNVILRREPKNLEILRLAQDDNSSHPGACPELAEGLRMTTRRLGRLSRSLLPLITTNDSEA